jgi:hypothetical protein
VKLLQTSLRQDPKTGQRLSQAKLEAEVAIMFLAGYETTGHTIADALCVECAVYIIMHEAKRFNAYRCVSTGFLWMQAADISAPTDRAAGPARTGQPRAACHKGQAQAAAAAVGGPCQDADAVLCHQVS